jgi:hypothetical protein
MIFVNHLQCLRNIILPIFSIQGSSDAFSIIVIIRITVLGLHVIVKLEDRGARRSQRQSGADHGDGRLSLSASDGVPRGGK